MLAKCKFVLEFNYFLPHSPVSFSCLFLLPPSPASFSCLLLLPPSPTSFSCLLILPPYPACFSCLLLLPFYPASFSCLFILPPSPASFSCLPPAMSYVCCCWSSMFYSKLEYCLVNPAPYCSLHITVQCTVMHCTVL